MKKIKNYRSYLAMLDEKDYKERELSIIKLLSEPITLESLNKLWMSSSCTITDLFYKSTLRDIHEKYDFNRVQKDLGFPNRKK